MSSGTIKYRKIGQLVMILGTAIVFPASVAESSSVTFLTLPTEYRPTNTIGIPLVKESTKYGSVGMIRIYNNGTLTALPESGTHFTDTTNRHDFTVSYFV